MKDTFLNTGPTQSATFLIILASTSPRRHDLLSLTNLPFSTLAVDIDESIKATETPQTYIERMVEDKSAAACQLLIENQGINAAEHNTRLIITADTIGVLPEGCHLSNGSSILVKPDSKETALAMWRQMSGKAHSIWTAVQLTLIKINHTDSYTVLKTTNILQKTTVTFVELTIQDMEAYWQTGEPQDKAGAYAIQGRGALWVDQIEGSYTNVVGLPLAQTVSAIKAMQENPVS